MVAVYQSYEVPEQRSPFAAAHAEVERLQAGLPRALLATPTDVLRSVAARAERSRRAAERWEHRVGPRPELAEDAEAEVFAAKDGFAASSSVREQVVDDCTSLLVRGNALAAGALGAAGGLALIGGSPMGLGVAVAVAAAPLAPLAALWLAATRTSIVTRDQRAARQRWGAALERTGVPTMGALAARRLAVGAWERRQREAAAAWEAARPHLRAWQRLAGPGVAPGDIDIVLARIDALRAAQLHLLGMLLDERVSATAMNVLAPEAEVAAPEAAPTWLEEAISRFRGGKLRLWGA